RATPYAGRLDSLDRTERRSARLDDRRDSLLVRSRSLVADCRGMDVPLARLEKLVLSFDLDPQYLDRLRSTYPDVEVVVCNDRQRLPEATAGAQALIGWGLTPELLRRSPDLRWINYSGAGVDGLLFPELIESDVIVTNNS